MRLRSAVEQVENVRFGSLADKVNISALPPITDIGRPSKSAFFKALKMGDAILAVAVGFNEVQYSTLLLLWAGRL